ncbi:hypothetical protein [Thiocapsa marina]|uniref:CheW domain protein n=1 Tax=Thiocapsa marina 5811 TaxID=768671 RepID=F9U746_9GAMM|nr:hypothetical protein [Thiocapsa marina]EGV20072.1 CheW domain protein [Thiocapsa marina 5811]
MTRTDEAQDTRVEGGIDLVLFNLGALRFAVDSEQIRGIADPAETPDVQAPALADLLGLAHARSATSPDTHGSRERLLRFRNGPRDAAQDASQTGGMRIGEPISLRHVPFDAIHPLPALMEALSALPCVRGMVALSTTNADDLAILLDPRRFPNEARTAPRMIHQ